MQVYLDKSWIIIVYKIPAIEYPIIVITIACKFYRIIITIIVRQL